MRKGRCTEAQTIETLEQAEKGSKVADLALHAPTPKTSTATQSARTVYTQNGVSR